MKSPLRFGLEDLRQVAHASGELSQVQTIGELREIVFASLEKIVPGSLLVNDKLELDRHHHDAVFSHAIHEVVKLVPRFSELIAEGHHPYLKYFMAGGREIAVRATDLVSKRAYHRDPIYDEVYRAADVPFGLFSMMQVDGYQGLLNFHVLRDAEFSDVKQAIVRIYLEQVGKTVSRLAYRSLSMEKLFLKNCQRFNLTPRETEVMLGVFRGRIDKEIADSLGNSTRTVSHQIASAFRKVKARSRTDAIRQILNSAAV